MVGPFEKVYVGTSTGSSVLTEITDTGTGPGILQDFIPEQYENARDNSVQSGNRQVTFGCTFLGDDDILINLSRGLAIDSAYKDAPSTFEKYSLLLIHPDYDKRSSIYIPVCYTLKKMDLNYDKLKVTEDGINFVFTNRNRFKQGYYMRTLDELVTIMDVRSPV